MQRNIVTSIEFLKGHISICVIEVIHKNSIEIYNSKAPISEIHSFIPRGIREVESIIGGRLNEVSVVIEATKKVGARIKLAKQAITIASTNVSSNDVKNLIEMTKQKYIDNENEVILIQPLQYEVIDLISKKYSVAPISKRGETLSMLMAVTTINKQSFDYIKTIIKSQNLSISQILLKPQTISQNNLSENALADGSVLIHMGYEQSYITVNKNKGTINLMSFYDFGLKTLLKEISEALSCTAKKAHELLSIYSTLDDKVIQMIHTEASGINETTFTSKDLGEIVSAFIQRFAILSKKYITQNQFDDLPIIMSGDLNSVYDVKNKFGKYFENLVLYKPLTYCEVNKKNRSTLGVINFKNRMSNILGENLHTIVETNPETISSLSPLKKKGIMRMIIKKIGGRYDWSN